FCQWVQLYGLDEPSLALLLATFRDVFPETLVLRPSGARELLLVGSARPLAIDEARVVERLRAPKVAAALARAGLLYAEELLGEVVAGTADVDAFAAGAPLNTDDSGRIELRAPALRFLPPEVAERALERLAGAPRGLTSAFAAAPPARRIAIAEGAARVRNFAAAEAWVRTLGD